MIMPVTSTDADAVARAGAGAGGEDEREVADDGGDGGHQDRAQTRAGGLDDGLQLALPCSWM